MVCVLNTDYSMNIYKGYQRNHDDVVNEEL